MLRVASTDIEPNLATAAAASISTPPSPALAPHTSSLLASASTAAAALAALNVAAFASAALASASVGLGLHRLAQLRFACSQCASESESRQEGPILPGCAPPSPLFPSPFCRVGGERRWFAGWCIERGWLVH